MILRKIPGSVDYRINLKGQIFDSFGNIVHLPTVGQKIRITLYEQVHEVDLEWLALLAWYECGFIADLHKHFDKIKFLEVDNTHLRLRCGKIMTFSEPIYYKEGYRYIPNHPRYAISEDGILLDTLTNEVITRQDVDNCGYSVYYIRTPDRNGNRHIKTHRLLSFAWIPNDDFINRPFVNHIDGDKGNNSLTNLEWVSNIENNRHALETGLIGTLIKTKVRDIVTGNVTIYPSIAEMNRQLGIGTGHSTAGFMTKLPGYLWDKRYEIKLADDDSPWFYEKVDPRDFNLGKSVYTFIIKDTITGEERIFNSARKIASAYGLRYRTISIERFILDLKERLPHLEVKFNRNALKGPYYVHDLESKGFLSFSSLAKVALHTGRSKAELQVDLSRGFKYIYAKRWKIITATNMENRDFSGYVDKPIPYSRIEITNTRSGEVIIARSMKDAARISGINFKAIRKRIETGIPLKGFIFRALDQ